MRHLGIIAVAAGVVITCAAAAQQPQPERPGVDYPLDGVMSVCDQFGHRVYRYRAPSNGGGVAVVPNDPTCVKVTIR